MAFCIEPFPLREEKGRGRGRFDQDWDGDHGDAAQEA